MTIQKKIQAFALAACLVSCGSGEKDYDATGTFEATEVTVSAEQNGVLLRFAVSEGNRVDAGHEIGLIDTVQLSLKALQIGATKRVYYSQRPDIEKQIAATREQLKKAELEYDRFYNMYKDGAANRKTVDDAESQVQVLKRQLAAQKSQLNNSANSLTAQVGTANVQQLQILDMLNKCHIKSPITGIVLDKYAEAGEYASVGKPLFKVADLDNMFLRAYITTRQLKRIRLGQKVTVFADYGTPDSSDEVKESYKGTVCWISDKSEFTPKTILTDDERADIVYAVKIAVSNKDNKLKIGMYGRVKF